MKKEIRKWQGQKWCRNSTRLAIYLRDGLACSYCGAGLEDNGTKLTLDHLKPHSKDGDNHPSNLLTACKRCNSARGNRSVASFTRAVSAYTQEPAEEILNRVRRNARRVLLRAEAIKIISRRKNLTGALTELKKRG